METTQSPSIESFSYSWSVNLNPPFDIMDRDFENYASDHDEAAFIEMDPRLPPSQRFFTAAQDFCFDFPKSESPLALVHADELISNGFLMPTFAKESKMDSHGTVSAASVSGQRKVHSSCRVRCAALRRCRRLSKHFVLKYLFFLRPLYQRMRGYKSRSGNSNVKVHQMKSWESSPAMSPRTSVAYSADNWRRSCDSESSIYEAVLHCKRTHGK